MPAVPVIAGFGNLSLGPAKQPWRARQSGLWDNSARGKNTGLAIVLGGAFN